MNLRSLSLMPPAPGNCPVCAQPHDPDEPHDATSLYYGFYFVHAHNRSPTWADAMEHCSDEVKRRWTNNLAGIGIDIHSTAVRGGITTDEELAERISNLVKPDEEQDA